METPGIDTAEGQLMQAAFNVAVLDGHGIQKLTLTGFDLEDKGLLSWSEELFNRSDALGHLILDRCNLLDGVPIYGR